MAQGFLLFLAFLLVLCVPSTNLQFFDGLPFSRLPEFAALVLALPFLIFPELRRRAQEFRMRWKIRPAYLWILLDAVLVFKIVLVVSGAHAGFAGCYRSPAEPTGITHENLPAMDCERSYENPFGKFAATRLDYSIWFGQDGWNLVFLNTSRYNYYDWEAGNILRPRIPIEAEWNGYPDISPGEPIRIAYVGEGRVTWGDVRVELPPAYTGSNVVEVNPPRAESLLQIEYSFDDGSRSGQDPESWGPRASIQVSSGGSDTAVRLAARNAPAGWRILALLADGLILLWILLCLPVLWQSVRSDRFPLIAFFLGIGFFSLVPAVPVIRGIGITCVLGAALIAHLAVRPFRTVSIYIIVIAAGLAILRVWSFGVGQVLLRSAGNDPLSYESQAYSILATGSLRGGESVFGYIPAYRYIKFLEHALFGDGNMLYAAVQLAAYFGGIFWLLREMGSRALPAARRILLVGLGCGLVFLGGYYVSNIIREGLSEYDTWILLLWALPGLYGMTTSGAILAGTIALGVSYTIRPNQLPGILWILFLTAAGSWRKHAKTILLAGILALGIALLPLAHNVYFGRQWVLTATSGGMPVNLVLLPSTWLAFLQGDPAAVAVVREQMGMLFLVADAPRSMLATLGVMAVFFLCWLAVTVYTIARRRWSFLPWLAVPVFFLAIHFLYGVSTYYPRHIVIAYLAMAITAVLALIRSSRTVPAAAGPAVELPRK
jgi:hypothetical protein